MKKTLLGLISVVFLMGAGLLTWNLTKVVDETIQIGSSTQDVLNIERTFKEDAILTEGETLTFKYDVKKLDTANDYYLSVSLTGASVDAVTITSITPENLQLNNEMQEVEIVIGLLETATPGEFTVQFLFEAIEGVFEASAAQQSNEGTLMIYEFYPAGGNSGAFFKQKYIVLYNGTDEAIDLSDYSLQYAAASESSTFSGRRDLSGIIQPEGFFLIVVNSGSNGIDVPKTPDLILDTTLSPAGTAGKIVLSSKDSSHTISGIEDPNVIDWLAYGTAEPFEGEGAAPAPSTTTSIRRKTFIDTNDNLADFETITLTETSLNYLD